MRFAKYVLVILVVIANLIFVTPASSVSYNEQVLAGINEARSVGRYCGNAWYPAVGPVKHNTKLAKSSRRHSIDMGTRNYFAHSYHGSTLKRRLKRVHYRWRNAGEILAAGQQTPQQAVQAWLDSPGHCKVLMGKHYRHAGVGFVIVDGSRYTRYWTIEFARPR